MTLLTVASKVAAFGRDVVLSSVYGAGPDTDAFFIANAIPGVLWAAFWTTIGMVFMPLYTAERRRSVVGSSRFANNAVLVYAGLSLTLTIVCLVFARAIVAITAADLPEYVAVTATHLTMIMSVGFFFTGYVSIQNAIQQSRGQLLPPLVGPLFNNLLSIVGVFVSLLFGGIYTVVAFAVLGWVAQAPLQRLLTRRFYRPNLPNPFSDALTRKLLYLSVPVFFGVFLDQINAYIGIYLSSGFGEGSISHLNYANRLTAFMAGLFSMLVAYLIFPRLAEAASRDEDEKVTTVMAGGLGMILAATAPMVVLSLGLSREIVDIVFGRGKFLESDVTAAAAIFQFYVYGILFVAVREIFNRLLFSFHKTSIPLYIGVLAAIVNVVVSVVLTRFMGPPGIAAGAAAGAIFYVVCQLGYTLAWKRTLLGKDVLRWLAVVGLASAAMAAALIVVVPEIGSNSSIARVLIAGAVTGAVYALVLFGAARFIRPIWIVA